MSHAVRICPTCSSPFESGIPGKIYCKPLCRPDQQRSEWPIVVCVICHMSVRRKKVSDYCSFKCESRGQKRNRALFHASIDIPYAASDIPVHERVSLQKENLSTLYWRDHELFQQRMIYMLDNLRWEATPCCYCGDPAEAEDHVLPQVMLEQLFAVGRLYVSRDILRIVPSCHECNTLLGDRAFSSFEEKRLFAKKVLSKRYHGVLDIPNWSPEELSTLKGNLHRWVSQRQGFRDLVFERLRY